MSEPFKPFSFLIQTFHNVCYRIEERRQLLSAINDFLDDSVVLPPGDWDSKNLLSVSEIQEMRKRRKKKAEEDAAAAAAAAVVVPVAQKDDEV